MIRIGQFHSLPIVKHTSVGVYLDADSLGEVLLPRRYVLKQWQVGDKVRVFLYSDKEDRPIATTETPKACVGEFAYLEAVAITEVGAFLDWGLKKDVLVPFSEQHKPMVEGDSYLVYLYLGKLDGRITATSKIDKLIDDEKPSSYNPLEPVELIIANSTDLGLKAIINHSHWGVLYNNELNERLSFGQSIMGYIKYVRPDGRIDLSLQTGQQSRDKNTQKIISYLYREKGFAAVHDKSDPELIFKLFSMSKSAFKKAIGGLYKQRIISIDQEGIRLLEQSVEKVSRDKPNSHKVASDKAANNSAAPSEKAETKTKAKTKTSKAKDKPVRKIKLMPAPKPAPESASWRELEVTFEPLELYKILKFEGLSSSGAEAKAAVGSGQVLVNGEVETRKRKKIVDGDTIQFEQELMRIKLIKEAK